MARCPWLLDLLAFAAVLPLLAARLVPAHWTSIWWDREFSGWVAPITRRLADGQRLYVDGGHGPMPPLPAVLLLLTGGGPGWIAESAANFLLQALTLACLYVCLARHLARPAPLLATLAAIPSVFSASKAIFYDSLAQCLVAAIAWQAVEHVAAPADAAPAREWRRLLRQWRPLLLAALATAALVLTKQSTAAGALAGVVAAMALTRGLGARRRVTSIMVYLVAVALAFGLLACALAPWASPAGFVIDVLQTGAEPKGGSGVLLARLGAFLRLLARLFWNGAPFFVAAIASLVALHLWRARAQDDGAAGSPAPTLAHVAAFLAVGSLTLWLGASYSERALNYALLLALGLLVVTRLAAPRPDGEREVDLLFALACVTTPAALTHALSVTYLRWTVDSHPLVVVALAALATFALSPTRGLVRAAPRRLAAVVTLVTLQALTSGRASEQWEAARDCAVPWPEVEHLHGARLRASADGMRTLVARVRALAPDPRADHVLLLPEDPNVQAWFERPRPRLTSTIVFPDQYLDRYVDEDFERLRVAPPKVIVIGPRDTWRDFCRVWNVDRGAERLIDRLQRELLPARYVRAAEHPIAYRGEQEHMDVYVRTP